MSRNQCQWFWVRLLLLGLVIVGFVWSLADLIGNDKSEAWATWLVTYLQSQ